MALYCYVKSVGKSEKRGTFFPAEVRKFFPFFLIIVGLFLLANALLPILSYELITSSRFKKKLVKPLPEQNLAASRSEILGTGSSRIDYTKPSNWFPTAPKLPPQQSRITHYTISIPSLEISEAVVEIGGEDLGKSLIHYLGTAFPGQYGNVVIFGHSVLPQFFNPENYKTIFSTLPTLEEDDEILVDFDGISYRYQVTEMVEVEPEDVSVLEQRYDGEYLTLITCVPPGTYLRRLVARAKLIRI